MKIDAKIVAHSKSSVTGKEIITWELVYPRFIHSEFLTHRLFSRNAASSRAIPVAKMLEMVREHPAMPVRFGANQAGMQDKGVDHDAMISGWDGNGIGGKIGDFIPDCFTPKGAWTMAARTAAMWAEVFAAAGYHKQIANRLIEPYQWMKTVMTATEDDNWFWLRDHNDADPTIHALASVMWEAKQNSVPTVLEPGEWHLPYVTARRQHWRTEGDFGPMMYWDFRSGTMLTLKQAKAVSASCCAQVSYRKLDDTLEKAQMVYQRLVGSEPVHASPFEHQATPMEATNKWDCTDDGVNVPKMPWTWEEGITHIDRKNNFWSGNFKNWIQHRQLIPDNVCNNYVPSTKETTND